MKNTREMDGQIQDEVYTGVKSPLRSLPFFFIGVLLASFTLSFNLSDKIEAQVAEALGKNSACPIKYESLALEFFLPKVVVKNIKISKNCFKGGRSDLFLKDVNIHIRGVNPLKLALKTLTEIKLASGHIDLYATVGPTSQTVSITEGKVSLSDLAPALPPEFKASGLLDLKALVELEKGQITSGSFQLSSDSFKLLSQNIQGFDLPELNLKNVLIKGRYADRRPLTISEFILGDENSPLRAQLQGTIDYNKKIPASSGLNMTAETKFSASFLEQFGILNLLLNGKKTDEQGFYHFKLSGTLGAPKFNAL